LNFKKRRRGGRGRGRERRRRKIVWCGDVYLKFQLLRKMRREDPLSL
jgi:hypothetical protein